MIDFINLSNSMLQNKQDTKKNRDMNKKRRIIVILNKIC